MFSELDLNSECSELLPKSVKMCKKVVPKLFTTFLNVADSRDICHLINMCQLNNFSQKTSRLARWDTGVVYPIFQFFGRMFVRYFVF